MKFCTTYTVRKEKATFLILKIYSVFFPSFLPFFLPFFSLLNNYILTSGFPSGSDGKQFAYSAWDPGSILGLETSPGKKWRQSTAVFLPGEFHGQRSLMGYSPWGCKESDTTEWLSLSFFTSEQSGHFYVDGVGHGNQHMMFDIECSK